MESEIFNAEGEEEYRNGMELLFSQEQWNRRKALELFLKAAAKGHAEAMLQVGILYMQGGPQITQNPAKAFHCFQKSAEEGIMLAKYHLAECYKNGMGTEKNIQESIRLFEESAKYIIDSARELSFIYYGGLDGVSKDLKKAKKYIDCVVSSGVATVPDQFLQMHLNHLLGEMTK